MPSANSVEYPVCPLMISLTCFVETPMRRANSVCDMCRSSSASLRISPGCVGVSGMRYSFPLVARKRGFPSS